MTINITEGEHTTLHKKGQSFTEEHKKHLSEAHKGIKLPAFTEEHKKKISDAQRGDKNHMY